jgi:heptosyltransferase-2
VSERLLVFAPNWLGDAVMALPAIADVRRARPDTVIDVAARPSIAPLLMLMPGIDRGVTIGPANDSTSTVRAGRYDAALLLPNSFKSAWIARRADVPERWGYRTDCRSALLTRSFPPPVRVHQAEYYQRLTTALGFAPGPLEPRLVVPEEVRVRGATCLAGHGWDQRAPLMAVAPGAAYGGAKRWPAERFAAVIDTLAQEGVRAVLVGAAADVPTGREVVSNLRSEPPIDLIGATDLPMLAAILVHCRGLVTNDSGAMHVASALGVNVTAVFGPTNEHETRPLGSGRLSVVHSHVWCRPCMLRECPLTHRCMTGVTPDRVVNEARSGL